MSDKDDIAARRKAERERLKHYQQEIQAQQQDPMDVQSDASFLEGAFSLLGADTLADIESAAPYAQTEADRKVLDAFIKEARKGKRGNNRRVERAANKARKAYKSANQAKKKSSGWGCAVTAMALGGATTVIVEGIRLLGRA